MIITEFLNNQNFIPGYTSMYHYNRHGDNSHEVIYYGLEGKEIDDTLPRKPTRGYLRALSAIISEIGYDYQIRCTINPSNGKRMHIINLNKLTDDEINNFKLKLRIRGEMSSEEAKHSLINSVYRAAVIHYETIGEHGRLTDGKRLRGNGHHMAQKIATLAGELWDERLEDKN